MFLSLLGFLYIQKGQMDVSSSDSSNTEVKTQVRWMNFSFHISTLEGYGVLHSWDNYIIGMQSHVK